ncbi:HTH domain-containing protein [Natronomonas sp. EA1]|uniref:HTH domain-containing protein n=1 Tax=Natronomonas sp. EA1 TaxID=3421655 RepID=UPI003EB93220
MGNMTAEETVTIELFVRSLSPTAAHERQDELIERLSALAERGTIADYDVEVWGDAIPLNGAAADTPRCKAIRDHVEALRTWGEVNGVELPEGLTPTETSGMLGESREVVRPPTVTLVEYRDGELEAIAPRTEGGTTYTVADHLDSLTEEAEPVAIPAGMPSDD